MGRRGKDSSEIAYPYEVEWTNHNLAHVSIGFDRECRERWFLLTSDVHWDSRQCDRRMLQQHLDQARERGAGWIDNGDFFDAMGGKYDKRSSHEHMRPEHRRDDYLSALTETAADWLAPYTGNIIALGHGNHETSQVNRNGVDLTRDLCSRLSDRAGYSVRHLGYTGWIFFRLYRGHRQKTLKLYRHHGSGGGAPVTRGVIDTARMGLWCPDADVVIAGHNHKSYIVDIPRVRVTQQGVPYFDEQTHVRIPGYKNAWGFGEGGWDVERGMQGGPTSKGAAWLRIWITNTRDPHGEFHWEVTRAK